MSSCDELISIFISNNTNMSHCFTGVDEKSISELMAETPMLKSLCLRETQIDDNTLYSFLGSCLEMLDISDTKVWQHSNETLCPSPELL